MTHGLGVSRGAGRDRGEPRLQLKPSRPESTFLDGAWWPRSTQLAIELPVLVEALSDRLGEVAVVGYHRNAWTQTPTQMQVADATVQLQGFTSDEPASVILIGRDGRRVTLLVISPGASEAVAREKLDAASSDAGDADPANNQAERVAARSAAEVAAQVGPPRGARRPSAHRRDRTVVPGGRSTVRQCTDPGLRADPGPSHSPQPHVGTHPVT